MTKLLNLARLDRKLKRLPEVARAHIRAEMEMVAEDIVGMMRRLAPKDQGDLAASIGWTWGKAPKGAGVVATAKSSLGADMSITIYAGSAEAYYARWQEFGTQDMPASPYFYVSWRASKKAAKRRLRKANRTAVSKVVSS